MNDFILEAKGVSRTYDEAGSPLVIFENISFQVRAGERIAIVGSSGSGKSTFLNVVGGLDRATQGDVIIMGEPVMHISEAKLASIRNQHIGFVYQFHHLLGEFSALENVAMPLLLAKQSVSDAQHRAKVLLDIVGLGELLFDVIDNKPV
ncbi:MAG: ABC transporter ATP-binding protein, partial [Pontibacterium sp.]